MATEETGKKSIKCGVCGTENYPGEKWQIIKNKLLLAEGTDVHRFLIYACETYQKTDVQVIDFRGIDELATFLKNLVALSGFSKVETLVIARDAETDMDSARTKIISAIKNVKLPVPQEPFKFCSDERIKTAFMLFPGTGKNGKCTEGTLEDLCMNTVDDSHLLQCVDTFLECAKKSDEDIRHPKKSRLYAYLAGKNDHAGKKIGQAAKDRVWNFDHPAMAPFKKIIQEM